MVVENKEDEEVKKGENKEEVVTLSKESFDKMLNEMTELKLTQKRLLERVDKGEEEEEEENEVKLKSKVRAEEEDEVDIEDLSKKDLLLLMDKRVQEVNQKTMALVMTLAIKEEIKELKEELKEKGKDDFNDFKEDIHKLIKKNPQLRVKEAYLLAKEGKGEVKLSKEEEDEKKEFEEWRKKKKNLTGGERPGVTKSATKPNDKLSVKEAAMQALEEVEFPNE